MRTLNKRAEKKEIIGTLRAVFQEIRNRGYKIAIADKDENFYQIRDFYDNSKDDAIIICPGVEIDAEELFDR